jgi:hypothetical protein
MRLVLKQISLNIIHKNVLKKFIIINLSGTYIMYEQTAFQVRTNCEIFLIKPMLNGVVIMVKIPLDTFDCFVHLDVRFTVP